MKIPNVNCKHADGWGFCNKKPKRFFGLFKQPCPEVELNVCTIAERFKRPLMAPPAPTKHST